MNFKERQGLIIKYLVENNNKVEVTQLITELNISLKTLKSDISTINEIIEPFASEIISDKNMIHFITNHKRSYWLNVLILNQKLTTSELLKAHLLLSENHLTSYDLAAICYTSKSNVEKLISNIVWKYCVLNATRNRGYLVVGTKEEKLKELWGLLYRYIDPLNHIVTTKTIIRKIIDFDQSAYLRAINYNQQFITDYQVKHNDVIMFHFLICLVSEQLPYYKLSEKEVRNFFKIKATKDRTIKLKEIILKFLAENNISSTDQHTIQLLINHLDNLLQSNLQLEQQAVGPKLEQIKARFNYAYVLADSLIKSIQEFYSFEASSIETLYITIYLQTIINKNLMIVRPEIIIVTEFSDSITNYLATKLREHLASGYTIKTMALTDFQKYQISNEIIISTLKNIEDINYIQIPPLPSDENIFKIIKIIKKREISLQFDELFSLRIKRQTTPNNLLNSITKDVFKYALGNEEYINSVMQRYQKKLAAINGIIILHGDPNLAIKNQILIYNLATPLDYFGETINTVIILILNETSSEYFSNISKNLYRFIYNPEFAAAINSDIDVQKINWYLKGNYFTY